MGESRTDELMTGLDVSEFLRVPMATLYAWRYEGKGPRVYKVGRHLRYRKEDVLAWLEKQANGSRP